MNKVNFNKDAEALHQAFNISEERNKELVDMLNSETTEIKSTSDALAKFLPVIENENELAFMSFLIGAKHGGIMAIVEMEEKFLGGLEGMEKLLDKAIEEADK